MVRVAGLKAQVAAGVRSNSPDGRTPNQQLAAIGEEVSRLMLEQHRCLKELLIELDRAGICILDIQDLSDLDRKWLTQIFENEIFAVLTPIAVDPGHPFPFIPNLGFGLVMTLEIPSGGDPMEALIMIPSQLSRFIRLPGRDLRYVRLEHVLVMHLDQLFPLLPADRPRHVPHHPRQRTRDRRKGRGSGADL